MKYLYPGQVLYLHDGIVQQSGGVAGLRDRNVLESAVYRPQATFGSHDLYPDLFSKAGALGHSLILNHPFVDGNKRTGLEAMRLLLRLNGYDLKASGRAKFSFVMKVARKQLTEQEMSDWLKERCRPYSRSSSNP